MTKKALLIFSSLVPLCASPVFAQQAPSPRTETVIVTASALRQDAGEILQGVSVLSGAELTAHSFAGLGESLESVPGVASTFFGAAASRPIVRGLGEDRIRVLSNGLGGIDAASVSPDHAVTSDGLEAETIEVLKGPAALIYGGNAVGGVVNIVDQRIPTVIPEKGWGIDGSVGLSSVDDGRFATAAAVSRYGKLALRIAAFQRDTSDYTIPGFAESDILRDRARAAGLPLSNEEGSLFNSYTRSQSATIGVAWLEDWGYFGVSAKTLHNEYGLPNGPPIFDARGRLVAAPEGPAEGGRIDMRQTRLDTRLQIDRDIGYLDQIALSVGGANYRHIEQEPDGEIGTRFSNKGYEARLQGTTRTLGKWTGVIGLSALRSDFKAEGEEAFLPATETSETGFYVVERYADGKWGGEIGGRLDRKVLRTAAAKKTFDTSSVSGALFYKPVDGAFLGVTLSRTERAPTDQELFADGPHNATQSYEVGNPNLRREVASSIEGTARWTHGRIKTELNIWRIGFDGFIGFAPTGGIEDDLPVYEVSQRDATFTGGELAVSAELAKVGPFIWGVEGAFDSVRASFKGGGNVPRIPPQTLRIGTTLDSGQWAGRVEAEMAGDQNRPGALELPTEGYTMLHASVTWRPLSDPDRLAIVLDGQNLTDEDARVATSFLKDVLPRPGRSVRLVVKTAF